MSVSVPADGNGLRRGGRLKKQCSGSDPGTTWESSVHSIVFRVNYTANLVNADEPCDQMIRVGEIVAVSSILIYHHL